MFASEGNVALVHLILDSGAEVDALDSSGETPLVRACVSGHALVAAALLDRGASIINTDRRGHTLISTVIKHSMRKDIPLLQVRGSALLDSVLGLN